MGGRGAFTISRRAVPSLSGMGGVALAARQGWTRSPQSAPVQQRTAGQSCIKEKDGLGHGGLKETNFVGISPCQLHTPRGGTPGPQVWTLHDPENLR